MSPQTTFHPDTPLPVGVLSGRGITRSQTVGRRAYRRVLRDPRSLTGLAMPPPLHQAYRPPRNHLFVACRDVTPTRSFIDSNPNDGALAEARQRR